MSRKVVLRLAFLGGPVIWFINLEANFAAVGWVCQWQSRLVLAVLSLTSLLMVAAIGLIAWREWREIGADAASPHPGVLAAGGAVLSALFFIVIVAQGIPTLLLDGCQ